VVDNTFDWSSLFEKKFFLVLYTKLKKKTERTFSYLVSDVCTYGCPCLGPGHCQIQTLGDKKTDYESYQWRMHGWRFLISWNKVRPLSVEFHCIKCADVAKRVCESFMRCGESFITTKLHWHSYLVFSCAHETCTESDLRIILIKWRASMQSWCYTCTHVTR
jgi:hypothetical protein